MYRGLKNLKKREITGIVLTGGKSSRLGREKGLLTHRGITLTERAIRVLAKHCEKIILSAEGERYENFGLECIRDIEPERGPMMGIYSCMLASGANHHLVLAVDNIFVEADFYDYVLSRLDGSPAALPFVESKYFEPLVGYYHRDILPQMKAQMDAGNFKLPDLLKRTNVLKLDVKEKFPSWRSDYFKSINLPDDLRILS